MTASSQTHPGAQPPHDPRPLQTAVASYAAAIPAPGGPAGTRYDDLWQGSDVPYAQRSPYLEPSHEGPVCAVCGALAGVGDTALYPDPAGRRYPSGAQVLFCGTCAPAATPAGRAVTAVVAAEMAKDQPVTPRDIAAAEIRAGITFDPARIQAAIDAAVAQARAEDRAELAAAAQDRKAKDWFRTRQRAVGQLCEGRPLDYCVEVGEVLTALDGRTPTTAPLTITWDGYVRGPSGDTPNEDTIISCTTARGGPAALVLNDEKRLALGGRLLAVLHTAEGCTTPGCGMSADDLDASDPTVSGWVLVDVAGTEGGPRWWCNALCAQAAMAAAGAELAADDQAADLDARYGPGASDEYVLQQGEAMQGAFEDERGDDGDGAW